MNKWIKCEDRYPTDNEKYLTFSKWGIIQISYFLPSLNDFERNDIIHWMPLPDAPGDEK